MVLSENGWREENKATDLNSHVGRSMDRAEKPTNTSWELLFSSSSSAKCQAKLGFPHSEDIDAELIESLASSFQPTLLTHSCICVPPGYPDAHQISLAAILYPVSLPYLSLTFHTFNFNSHSNWKTRHTCHLLCEAFPDTPR